MQYVRKVPDAIRSRHPEPRHPELAEESFRNLYSRIVSGSLFICHPELVSGSLFSCHLELVYFVNRRYGISSSMLR